MKPEAIEDLIARYLGESLSEEEEKQFLDLLGQSGDARKSLGLELAIDRLIRESRKAPLDPERVEKALPKGSQDDFIQGVMGRLPKSPGIPSSRSTSTPEPARFAGRPVPGRSRGGWRTPALIPGLIAAGILAALFLYATLEHGGRATPETRGEGKEDRGESLESREARNGETPPGPSLAQAEEERAKAEAARRNAESAVLALRREEAQAARERDRAELLKEEQARKNAEEDLERLKTEREAVEATVAEARERERRAAAEAVRASEHPRPTGERPTLPRTEAVAAIFGRIEGMVRSVAGGETKVAETGEALLPGSGVVTGARDGTAVLVFGDRTEVVLGPGTEVREIFDLEPRRGGARGKRLHVAKGRVTATVSKQPENQPLVMVTPHGEARVLGTTFRLSVDLAPLGGATRLEVQEGRVRLSRPDGRAAEVTSGHYAVAAEGVDLTPHAILDRPHYEAALARRPDLLFFEDFEEDRWKRHWSSPSETSRVTEDRGVTLMGRRALEVRCKAGEPGTDGWHRLTMPGGFPKLHMRAYFYFPGDFDPGGAAGGLSLFRIGALPTGRAVEEGMSLWADHTPNGRDFFSAALVLTSRWTLQFYYYHPDQKAPKGDSEECDPAGSIALSPGRWHAVELMCQANDPGLKNGLLRAWIDGTFCGELKGIRFRDAESLLLREMALTGFYGPGPSNQSYFVDDVVVAREYIGAALGDAGGVLPRSKR
jgi:ferric-dicitrate binding protein FerR (iron transport regulator)